MSSRGKYRRHAPEFKIQRARTSEAALSVDAMRRASTPCRPI
jgi:hypothetical protein